MGAAVAEVIAMPLPKHIATATAPESEPAPAAKHTKKGAIRYAASNPPALMRESPADAQMSSIPPQTSSVSKNL